MIDIIFEVGGLEGDKGENAGDFPRVRDRVLVECRVEVRDSLVGCCAFTGYRGIDAGV